MSKLWHDSGVIDDEPSLWPGERDAINLSRCRADEAARITGLCADGKPCGWPPELGDDRYCAECPNIPQADSNQADAINPSHYTFGGIETIDYMKAKATPEEYRGHLRLTALKYLSRAGHKDEALQEYRKAQWYLQRLIDELIADNHHLGEGD